MRALAAAAGLLLLVSFGPAAAAADADALLGVWRNPKDSVHIELRDCGARLCGRVLWASEQAKAKARDAGTDPLVGVDLLRNMEPAGEAKWRGRVFVPDLKKEVRGTIEMLDDNRFRARSCALGLVCKSQVWTRLPPPT